MLTFCLADNKKKTASIIDASILFLCLDTTTLFPSIPPPTSTMKFSVVAVASLVSVTSAFTAPKSSFMGKTSVAAVSSGSNLDMKYKVAVVGGGPSGACAAEIFAQEKGIDTVMFERKMDNAKPCGGAIPLCMVGEFDIPETVVDRKVRARESVLIL